jgi:uncharacterized protein (UPF0333 family)
MEQAIAKFLDYGLLGAVVVILGGVIAYMQKKMDKKDEEIKSLNQALNVVQEKRLADTDKYIANFVVLGKDLVNADAALQKSVDNIARVLEFKK